MILNWSATQKLQGLFSVLLEENISTVEQTLYNENCVVFILRYCFAAVSQTRVVFLGEELAG